MRESIVAPQSLAEVLRRRAVESPERGYLWLAQGEEEEGRLSLAGLDRRASAIASSLAEVVPPGERVLLLLPPGLEFVAAFFGCLYAGVIAVPAYPPHSRRPDARLQSITADCRPRVALTSAAVLSRREALVAQVPELATAVWLDSEELREHGPVPDGRAPRATDVAFLQYTSGSTGTPKGVVVTHANLLHNLERIRRGFNQTAESVVVGWLPLFHDMGLIGNVLQPCYTGSDCVLMSPAAFLQKPVRWLRAIHRYRGTTSGGPNFAYDLCVRSIGAAAWEELDLSSWSVAFNGAEPVRRATLERFAEAFAVSGFRREAFAPCYGLAESTLLVTVGRVPAASDGANANSAAPVSCGALPSGDEVRIVEPETGRPRAEGEVGEIWVAGPSVAAGYWNRPEATRETFGVRLADGTGPYLRTGDLGLAREGELIVTGRLKELIILRGRNLYPQDLELTAEQAHPVLHGQRGAAFSVDEGGEERLVVVHEVERRLARDGHFPEIADAIRRAVAEEHGVGVAGVALLRAGTIPKTTSGKIRRQECRARYLDGTLETLYRSADRPGSPERLLTRFDLVDLDPAERAAALTGWLREEIARRAGVAVEEIDAGMPLAAAGLDSLSLLNLQGRLEGDLGLPVGAAGLAELTVAGLGDRILSHLAEVSDLRGVDLPPLVVGEVLGDHPLAPGQEALWFLEQSLAAEGTEGVLHLAAAARLGAEVDGAALLCAARTLAARHPVLRTTFGSVDDALRQRVHASLPPDLAAVDATAWSPQEMDEALRREARRRLDLGEGSPLRLRLFHRPDGQRVLLLVLHHLVGDFWSLAVLLRDWAALYARELDRSRPPLPGLPAAYTDFIRWQRALLDGPAGERLESYWLDRLRGAPLVLDLPTDRPRPRVAAHAGFRIDLRLDSILTGRLRQLGRARGATLFTTLLAVFQVLLGRLTGQDDLLLGSPTTGRRERDFDGVVGYFVNPVVLRADLSGDPPFATHLERTRHTVFAALEHRDLPFVRLTQALQPVRDPGRPPVVQVFFVLQRAAPAQEPGLASFALGQAGARIALDGLALESLRLDTGTSQLDLTLSAAEAGEALVLSCEADAALFDGVTIGRWLGHLRTLLDAAAAVPERRLGELEWLTAEEILQLRAWNATAVAWPLERPLHAWIEDQADRAPEAVAIVCEGEELTYGALDRRANRLARWLRAQGCGPESRVGVLLERSAELLVALLGVLKAGAAYVPLDPEHPADRRAFQERDARLRLILTHSDLAACLPDDGDDGDDGAGETRLAAPIPPDCPAYVLYTSGSTGRPKGVMISHRAIVNRLLWMQEALRLSADDRVLQKTPFSFDVSVWELFWPLMTGARLVVARPGGHRDNAYLAHLISAQGITVLHFVPSMLQLFLEEPGVEACRSLRDVVCSGEALPAGLARRFASRLGHARLHNLYGPTEAAVDVTSWVCGEGDDRPGIPIGRPIANTRIHLLSRSLLPAPVGVPGELFIGGVNLARGYVGRPDLTAERFLPDPWGDGPGERVYRTGDLARRREDGAIEFLGRLDHQVKIHGFRIEPGEIEAVLMELDGVRDAVVLASEDRSPSGASGQRLVAYVVGDLAADALRRSLRERLPDSMVPSAFVMLQALPLTPNGKVDRKALPALRAKNTQKAHLAPRTPAEEVLAGVWSEVLGRERLGATDHFFELGGHSLLAMRVTSRLRAAFGVEVPLRTLFEAPVLADLAARIEAARRAGSERPAPPPIVPILRGEALPLSFAQQRLWFLDQLAPSTSLYNMPGALRIEGPLDARVLALCLGEIARRHEVLRTTFVAREGSPVQVIHPAASFALPVVDLSALPERAREALAIRLAEDEAGRPFDLSRGPLLRGVLLQLAERDHVAALTLHHIVSDGWSLDLLVRELSALYPALAEDRPSPLPELSVQYADFAVWQRSWLQGEILEREISFWRRQLAGLPPLLALPTDRPRPAVQSFRGASRPLRLPDSLVRQLRDLGRREGATLFMVLLAGVQALLARNSGQRDIAVGAPVAGRDRLEIEGLVGFFVNTLVLRGDVTGHPTFRELLGRARETVLAAYDHQDVPFERLVQELAPERSLVHSPLVQVMLALQRSPLESLEIRDLRLRRMAVAGTQAKLDLAFSLEEHEGGGLDGTVELAADLFDEVTVDRLIQHCARSLAAAVAAPELPVLELPLLSSGERHQVTAEWNDTGMDEAWEGSVPFLVERRSRERPADPAVVDAAGRVLTYGELADRAGRLAGFLTSLGIGPESIVGVLAERSPDLMTALLGVLGSGAAYLPLDPALPAGRLALMLEETAALVILTQEPLLGRLPKTRARIVCLDRDRGELERCPAIPLVAVEPDHLAYVLYTSGSTGRPKGVQIPHRGLTGLVCWDLQTHGTGPGDRRTQIASLGFDASVWEIWSCLASGAALHLPGEETRLDPPRLGAWMAERGITVCFLPTPLAEALLAAGADPEIPGLRRLLVGGDRLRLHPDPSWSFALVNHYGPTEASVVTTAGTVPSRRHGEPGPLPSLGRPIDGVRVLVLDGNLLPVGLGVPGELWVGGASLARGYLGDPGRTAERFLPDPSGSGGRLYRTGDLGRHRPDGTLEFLGRTDHQVKIRGVRIELAEIEASLAAVPGVRAAVVMAREERSSGGADRRLIAYVVGEVAASTLRQSLLERLPGSMVPSAFVTLASLPLTSNGKIDRAALPAPERSSEESDSGPRNQVEEVLAGIWAELLGIDRVGTADHFFDLGGHSLLAARVMSRLRASFGVELALRTLFEAPRLADLAARVEAALQDGASRPAPPLVPLPRSLREGPLPLSFAQQRLWFIDQLAPGSPLYNMPAALRIDGPLSPRVLALCFSEIARRHEALRTVFPLLEGAPAQVIRPAEPFPLPIVDLAALPEDGRKTLSLVLAGEEGDRPFDLARGPVLRAVLLRLSAESHLLALTLHHIASDGWSVGILIREVAVLYEAFAAGRPSPLSDLPVQPADYAVWQSSWLQGEVLRSEISFWRRQLAGLPSLLELPTDRPRPAVESHRGASRPVRLPAGLVRQAESLGRREGATLFMVLLTGFQSLLARWSGQQDLAVGTPVAGRNRLEIEELIGFFVNTLVLRCDLSGGPTVRALLGRVREISLAAHLHQDVPFEKLVQELSPERSLAHAPLFQVLLSLQNAPSGTLAMGGLRLRPLGGRRTAARFDLAVDLEESDGGLRGAAEHSTDLFDPATIDRLLGHFEQLLAGMVASPESRVDELGLLTAEETLQLHAWNPVDLPEPAGMTIHGLIEAQVDRTPESPAVLCADRALSYAELDRRANRLASRLRHLGAGPGRRVAVCVRRSEEMVVALLGILKSGAAYLPLDPAYPGDRLAFMLEDAAPVAVVVEEATAGALPPHPLPATRLDGPDPGGEDDRRPAVPVAPEDLAYVIYTSGSTGRPKGVMLSHGNAVRFFAGIDRRFGRLGEAEGWLAVTSLSFDISVLELLWPLTRGVQVIVQGEREGIAPAGAVPLRRPAGSRPLAFSLFYFADDEPSGGDKYRLLLEGARFADEHGFEAVWTPERHFHSFGGLYPNPSVTGAAVAAVTRRVGIRAGSVVLPLHDPIRVAEEWSVVDNLSGGRVGISFASGWHGDDFVFAPQKYEDRREVLFRDLETVRALWRGEAVTAPGGQGVPVEVRIRPLPVQRDLPVWITAAGNPDTFRRAGEVGAHLLTHLLGQSLEELAENVALYRRAWREGGHAGAGRMTLMLHTFVGERLDEVRAVVREPFRAYLRSSVGLLANHARGLGLGERLEALSAADMDALLDHAFEHYFATGALLGTPASCLPLVERFRETGVDELACLIDFGVPADAALAALRGLAELAHRAHAAVGAPPAATPTVAEALLAHRATWLQATPSMVRMLAADPEALAALRGLRRLLVGGEALPEDLAQSLLRDLPGVELHNMYGPTETTVWSTAQRIEGTGSTVSIGLPLAGEQALVLDSSLMLLPVGVPGELYLGGSGVAQGYHRRPELTAERFVPNPFSGIPGACLYRTGDLVRRRPGGELEFLGRVDHQVKVRGHRIEPGEIEERLRRHAGVSQALVIARSDAAGEVGLVAYVVPARPGEASALAPVAGSEALLAGRRRFRLPNGLTIAALNDFQALEIYSEIFRDHVYLRHGIQLEDGACIFDVGSNIGLFSLWVSQTCRRPRIYAFEPMPATFDVLRTNVALYGLDAALFNHAIADRPAVAELTFYPNAPGMSGRFGADLEEQRAIIVDWLAQTGVAAPSVEEIDALLADRLRSETVVCSVRPLSEVIAEIGVERIDLLKIDVEGSEVDVLRGLSPDDWPKIRQIVAEVHSPELLAGARSLLEAQGFEIAADDVALVEPAEGGATIHVTQIFAVRREDGGTSRSVRPAPEAAGPPSVPALRAWLRERLPELMVPAAFVTLDALPLTPNGKIDRKALPAPEWQRSGEGWVVPRTPVEQVLAGIWAEVLGVERVGASDNFFELGGHSLQVARVVMRLRAAFDIEIPLRSLFEAPVLADLAAIVESALGTGGGRLLPPLVPVPREGPLPLSFAQQRLWLIEQLEPGTALYNVPVALRVEGRLDASVLALALGEVVRRHETLRTVFVAPEGEPAQVIRPAEPFRLPVVDLSGLPEGKREAVALGLAGAEAVFPFDLARGPLLRGMLLRLGARDHLVALTLHHIAGDGWSMGILVHEVTALHAAFTEGIPAPLAGLPVQYADFAVWQSSWLRGELLEAEIAYWRRQLAGLPPLLALPTDRPRPAMQSYRGLARPVGLPAGLVRQAQALGRREGATLFMVLLAGFQALLARSSGQDDLAVGSPVAGRNRMEVEGLIGFFVNTLVLRGDLSGGPSFRTLLGRTRETALAAHMHQDVPFEKLVRELAPERSLAHAPLFQVMLSLQNAPVESLELRDLRLRPVDLPGTTAKFDLTLTFEERNGGLTGTAEHATDLFDAATIDRLLVHWERLLAAAAATPDASVFALPLLAEAERHQILREWGGTASVPQDEACLHDLFAAQVRRTPEAIALIAGGREILYRELDQEAGRLAVLLRRRGAGPEVVVGVFLDRSAGMVAALLAILRVGAAYLPLAPQLPRPRLAEMLTGAGVSIVISDERLAAGLPWSGPLVLVDHETADTPVPGLEPRPLPENLAYVLFTSGSTGTPKGVAVTHGSAAELVRWAGSVFAPWELAGVLAATALSFDLSVFELFVPLSWGGTVILAQNILELPALIASGPAAGRVTLVNTVPSALSELVRAGSLGPSIRTVNLAGEPLPRELANRLYATGTVDRVWNLYGPSEDTTYSTFSRVPREGSAAPRIGRPITATKALVLAGPEMEAVPAGVAGELYLGGGGLARGYLHRPDLTAERFLPDPLAETPGGRIYRTGDLVRWTADGELELLGRVDRQVKIRGFRIELGEIEAALTALPGVREAAVLAREDAPGQRQLVAYVVGSDTAWELRRSLREVLPDYMVPAAFVRLPELPLTPHGKVDRKALPAPVPAVSAAPRAEEGRSQLEEVVAGIWCEVLGVARVGVEDNFFDLGGHSLLLPRVQARLRDRVGKEVTLVELLTHSTVRALVRHLEPDATAPAPVAQPAAAPAAAGDNAIAIVGLAGRFPGAAGVEQLWANLCAGICSISRFSDEELRAAGVDPALRRNPRYVSAGGALDGVELFDADFFGYNPREAEILDPQQRLFLECAWEALEDAGYDSRRVPGPVGVFGGLGFNSYLHQVYTGLGRETVGELQLLLGNDKDFLASRVSYKLDLQGPSLVVQTACSSSLVAVHLACQNLLLGTCGMALAGGVSISLPQRSGYLYDEGGILSPDGGCRAFDAEARGSVGGSGVGIVVLKRLADALADGDTIRAVIRGSAVNNDGSGKAGYTAPSVAGQDAVITAALAAAGIEPATVSYVEAHGTGTVLGDPIEVRALAQAFRRGGPRERPCALGSVKSNLGHLNAAAGVAGLIKAALALQHGVLPPSLGFSQPNPQIDFAAGPFFVQTELAPWERGSTPRRAGVSSFGLGGTNAHAVLEEPPAAEPSGPSRSWQVLLVSARTPAALEAATDRLAARLEAEPGPSLPDIAFTLQAGRRPFAYRRAVVARSGTEAAAALRTRDPKRIWTAPGEAERRSVVFLLPGVGDQYPGIARGLYRDEPVFRREIDLCAELLLPHLGLDLRDALFAGEGSAEEDDLAGPGLLALLGRGGRNDGEGDAAARPLLQETRVAQPAMFAVGYALARLWMSWGVQPQALLGYSLGEYTAACLAGVLELPDALALVARRARLIGELPPGALLAVPLAEEAVRARLGPELSLAALNAPEVSVVAGPPAAVAALEKQLAEEGIPGRRLRASHAYHSWMMQPIAGEMLELVRSLRLAPPRIPCLSNVTGTWIEPAQATDPEYWVRHLVSTVRFADAVAELWREPGRILLEMGPGQTLGSLALQQAAGAGDRIVLSTLRHELDPQPDQRILLQSLGRLWACGADVDWSGFYAGERRRRVPLPTYPFERQRFWVEGGAAASTPVDTVRRREMDEWLYVPSWRRTAPPASPLAGATDGAADTWLLFAGGDGLARALAARLERTGRRAVFVEAGDGFSRREDGSFTIAPGHAADYEDLLVALRAEGREPAAIVHAFSLLPEEPGGESFEQAQELGLYSLLHLVRALAARPHRGVRLRILSSGLHEVTGAERLYPARASIVAIARVVPQEEPGLSCRVIDLERVPAARSREMDRLFAEIAGPEDDPVVAWRGGHRWVQTWERVRAGVSHGEPIELRPRGVYLITGGLGNVGLTLAELLAESVHARLVLVGRTPLPERSAWARQEDATLRRLLAMEERGAEVLALSADVAERSAFEAAVRQAEERFGRLDGVIHAAGHIALHAVGETGPGECAAAFRAKVHGARVLAEVLRGRDLDFVLACSSLSPVLGGLGFTAYAASNLCLDSFVMQHRREEATPWISVGWEGFVFHGNVPAPDTAITPGEGKEVFRRILALGPPPHLLVSTADLEARLDLWVRGIGRPTAGSPSPATAPHARPELSSAYSAPRNEVESVLAQLWQDLLGMDRIGVHDSFFELGGHSLMATRLLTRIRERFMVTIPLRTLFEAPTPAELAARIEAMRQTGAVRSAPPLVPVLREGALPLSMAQQRLWFIDQLGPGTSHYNIPVTLRIAGRLDAGALERAFGEIVRRHEALRTVFAARGEWPEQVILPASPFRLAMADLTALPERDREAVALARASEEIARPFDLTRGPLLRALLLRLGEETHILALAVHHIVSDGWSMDILIQEMKILYGDFLAGRLSSLPELPVQYADFAVWQSRWLDRETLDALAGYWRRSMAGAPQQIDLAGARPRPPVLSSRGAARHHRLKAPLPEQLRALGRRRSATLFMTLLAPLQALLHARAGVTDVVVGTDVAGRDHPETEGLIGFFINQLPLRANLAGDPTLLELLGRSREAAMEAYAHQSLPFDALVEALQVKPSLQRSPVFQVKLVLKHAQQEAFGLPDLILQEVPLEITTAQLDLHCSVTEVEEELWVTFAYSTDLFDEEMIDGLLSQYEVWLRAFIERPEARLGEVAAELARAERARLAERELEVKAAGLAKLRGRRREDAGRLSRSPLAGAPSQVESAGEAAGSNQREGKERKHP